MPVTSKDIARRLGIAQSTVSRVLSEAPGHRVSGETRRRVLEAAREMGYRPNAVARSLRVGRTQVVGFYTRHNYDARNEFLGAVLGGLQRACARRQLDLMLTTGLEGRDTEEVLARLRDGRIDGLLLHATSDDPVVARLPELELPVVAIADPLPRIPAVTCDDAGGMRQLIEHLWARGCRRFRYIAPSVPLASVERRRDAFERELAGRAEQQTLRVEYENVAPVLPELLAAVAGPDRRPLAACCWNDRTAYELLRACLAAGAAVPEQIAVAGFDGFLDTKLPARQLLTVACPWDLAAERALDLLSQRIAGQDVPPETTLPVRLVVGNTA